MSSNDEQALTKKAQAGDRQALGTLWDQITPKLFGYLVNVLRDQQLAEDILQTTWLKAISALPKFQSRGVGLDAWLFAIARNECKQHWRRSKFEVPFDPEKHEQTQIDKDDQNALEVEQILNFLSEEDRELLRLRYIADLSISDIAKVLNINPVAARVRVHRALNQARQIISKK